MIWKKTPRQTTTTSIFYSNQELFMFFNVHFSLIKWLLDCSFVVWKSFVCHHGLTVIYLCSRKSDTTQNLSLNISGMLSRPAFNRYNVIVTAMRGGQKSDPGKSAIFSFNENALTAKIKCMFSLYLVELWNIIYHSKHMQYDLTVLLCIQVIWIFPRLNFFPKMVNFTSSSSTLHICTETHRL